MPRATRRLPRPDSFGRAVARGAPAPWLAALSCLASSSALSFPGSKLAGRSSFLACSLRPTHVFHFVKPGFNNVKGTRIGHLHVTAGALYTYALFAAEFPTARVPSGFKLPETIHHATPYTLASAPRRARFLCLQLLRRMNCPKDSIFFGFFSVFFWPSRRGGRRPPTLDLDPGSGLHHGGTEDTEKTGKGLPAEHAEHADERE